MLTHQKYETPYGITLTLNDYLVRQNLRSEGPTVNPTDNYHKIEAVVKRQHARYTYAILALQTEHLRPSEPKVR